MFAAARFSVSRNKPRARPQMLHRRNAARPHGGMLLGRETERGPDDRRRSEEPRGHSTA